MNLKFSKFTKRVGFVVLTISVLASCDKNKAPKQAPPPSITVVEVIQKDVPIYKDYVGQIFGQEDVSINARVEGFLTGIHFLEGSRVEKGQLLYSIDPEPLKAEVANQRSKVAEAQTRLVNAENELERYIPLAEIDAVSKSDLDFAQASRDASVAGVEAAKASLRMAEINLSYTKIKSPISGFIGKTNARVGEFVGRNPSVVLLNTVSELTSVRVQFFLTESQYLILGREYRERLAENPSDVKQEIDISLILADGTKHPYNGKVDFVNREVDATTGAILVQASFPNPNLLLKPGQYAKVVIMMHLVKGGILVPQRCITEIQGQYSVFVVNDQNIVESRQITISERVGDLRLVSEGLQAGEDIVIDALQKVRTGTTIAPEKIEFESKSGLVE